MFTIFMLCVPVLIVQAVAGRKPLLVVSPIASLCVLAAVLLQIAGAIEPTAARTLVPASFALGACAAAWTAWLSSRSAAATGLITIGCVANLVPIAVYGAMPVAPGALAQLGATHSPEPSLLSAKHAGARDLDGLMHLLSDSIAVPAVGAVVSLGDVIIVAAFAVIGATHRWSSTNTEGREQRNGWFGLLH